MLGFVNTLSGTLVGTPMIGKRKDPVAWAMLTYELADAAEALDTLIRQLEEEGYGEPEFRIDLGHVYAHLNRAWHMRDVDAASALNPSESVRHEWTQFPTDLTPIG